MAHEQTRTTIRTRGSVAFDEFMRKEEVAPALAAAELGVSRQTIMAWRSGEKTPDPANQERIELFCAVTDPVTHKPHPHTEKPGHWSSHVPREWWTPEGALPPKAVRPFAAIRATEGRDPAAEAA